MVRGLISHSCFALAAYQQATICADAAGHGLALGLLTLFFCLLANQLVASWLKGH